MKNFNKTFFAGLIALGTVSAGWAQTPRDLAKEASNKAFVAEFFDVFYNKKDLVRSRSMMAPDLISHHPFTPKGAEGKISAVKKHLFDVHPAFSVSIKRILAEGDLVWIQSYTKDNPKDHGKISMDIFRVHQGKIAEHWDVIQAVPEQVEPSSMY